MTVFTYGGLTIGGPGSPYKVTVHSAHDTPEVRSSDEERSRRHGLDAGEDLLGGRSIIASITIVSPHPSEDVWAAFSAALVPGRRGQYPLTIQTPGLANGATVTANARVRRLVMPSDLDMIHAGVGKAVVEWFATDPRLYGAALNGATVPGETEGGVSWPISWPLVWGGSASGGQMTLTNLGEFDAPWVATITGPVTNPRIRNQTTGQEMRVNMTVEAGQTLVIDEDARTILLNGTGNRRSMLAVGSEWFSIVPGANVIQYAALSGSGPLTIVSSSAWV